jgi:hypothetical protein
MGLIIYVGKVLEIKVGIDLSSGNARVAQHLLNRPQITAGFEHVGRERVP